MKTIGLIGGITPQTTIKTAIKIYDTLQDLEIKIDCQSKNSETNLFNQLRDMNFI